MLQSSPVYHFNPNTYLQVQVTVVSSSNFFLKYISSLILFYYFLIYQNFVNEYTDDFLCTAELFLPYPLYSSVTNWVILNVYVICQKQLPYSSTGYCICSRTLISRIIINGIFPFLDMSRLPRTVNIVGKYFFKMNFLIYI